MNPAATLKVVEIIAVNSIIRVSASPFILIDNLPSSNDVSRSITPRMKRGKEVKIASKLCEKNKPKASSINPSIKMTPPVLVPKRY